ncbi:PfkB family carbohydrate kinase [Vulcanisaeta souniana]|uniref:Carbohydrate kinase PfkB domain-containing protein n=2 Tax=Vulcanisaeta souniana TaxID=164452 RepID=A0A830E595_9CREN|nr:PfkB family carbohydrate kinase [Vulcanisaeta souniana]BDR91363.1 hypothetical protein Vsou_04560 [Vulcanisaeta souniana JCM 11219]GGI72596.1 hypothetical protein GCM10007112_06780 [Vulcanisaeta souniana JCM 11219]
MLGIVGHAAIDIIKRGAVLRKSPGGAPTYCSFYLRQLGVDLLPISVVGRDFSEYIMEYARRNIPVDRICVSDGCGTTSYEITYYNDSSRKLRLLSRCRDFVLDDLRNLPGVVVVNPIAREVSLEVLEYIRSNTEFVGVDIQGFIRVFNKDNYVSTAANTDALTKIIKVSDVIKMSIDDLQMPDVNILVNSLARQFPSKAIILSMGARGSLMLHNGHKFQVSTDSVVHVRDPTGAGDVLTCMITHMLSSGEDPLWSFIYSNATAVAKTMGDGPYGTISRAQINEIADVLASRIIKS